MKQLHTKKDLFVYALGGMGLNILNLIMESYLCDAVMVEGFSTNVDHWTYANKTLVIGSVWAIMIVIAKVIDGLIDIPLSHFADNFRSKHGHRKSVMLRGYIPTLICYVLFLYPLNNRLSMSNTLYLGLILCLFYIFYTLTMVAYYATFSEITQDVLTLSHYKSICDIIYFVCGFIGVPFLITYCNIRMVALIFLPFSLLMIAVFLLIKEDSNLHEPKESFSYSFKGVLKDKNFMIWMIAYAFLQFGLQMYMTGINVYASGTLELTSLELMIVMICVFAPVPFTLKLYRYLEEKWSFKQCYSYSIIIFSSAIFLMSWALPSLIKSHTLRIIMCIMTGLTASFSIGNFFSLTYTIPALMGETHGPQRRAMYFAIQGVVSGISVALATGLVWVNLKVAGYVVIMPYIVMASLLISLILVLTLNINIKN